MKKKKILAGVAIGAALAAVALQGCDRSVFEAEALYGPPPEDRLAVAPAAERSARQILHSSAIEEKDLADPIWEPEDILLSEEG